MEMFSEKEKERKESFACPVESGSRLLDAHWNYRLVPMETESNGIHWARCNAVACMWCTRSLSCTRTFTLKLHSFYSNIKLTALRLRRHTA